MDQDLVLLVLLLLLQAVGMQADLRGRQGAAALLMVLFRLLKLVLTAHL